MEQCIDYGDLVAFIIAVVVVAIVVYLQSKRDDSNDIHRHFRDKLEDED